MPSMTDTYAEYVEIMKKQGYMPMHIHSEEKWKEIVKQINDIRASNAKPR